MSSHIITKCLYFVESWKTALQTTILFSIEIQFCIIYYINCVLYDYYIYDRFGQSSQTASKEKRYARQAPLTFTLLKSHIFYPYYNTILSSVHGHIKLLTTNHNYPYELENLRLQLEMKILCVCFFFITRRRCPWVHIYDWHLSNVCRTLNTFSKIKILSVLNEISKNS